MKHYAEKITGRGFTHLILWSILGFVTLFLLSATILHVNVVTKGEGAVVPSKRVQIIANLEGGIVRNVFVKQGQIVKKGQVLMQLDDLRFKSEYQEGLARETALRLKIASLSAILSGKPFSPDPKLAAISPELTETEKAFYIAKTQELQSLLLRDELLQKEIKLTTPLVNEGIMSKVELLRLQQQAADNLGRLSNTKSALLATLSESRDKYAQVSQQIATTRDRATRTAVRAPLYGVVKQVLVTTEGGVIKPGDPLLEIVPLDDTLLIEARIIPSKIGFIHINQKAKVRVTAYDYTIYGGIDGYVENISSDTLKDEKENSYYQVWVRTSKNYVSLGDKKFLIYPGMTATVDLLTGRRSIMHYILKPFMRAQEAALIER